MSSSEDKAIQTSVVTALRFVDGFVANFNDQVLYMQTVDFDEIARDLHRRMRTELPVPSIYCTVRILQRLVKFAGLQRDALENERTLKLPGTKTDVDYTVKKIFVDWNGKVQVYMNQNSDFNELNWNPWSRLHDGLDSVVKKNAAVFFGI